MVLQRLSFLVGLFLTTLATLTLEILDTRLLSVLTWYHLSFLAVSLAMLGMAAGAVYVYLGGRSSSAKRRAPHWPGVPCGLPSRFPYRTCSTW